MLLMLLGYGVWSNFFDRSNKAKKQRLVTIRNSLDSVGQNIGSSHNNSALEIWLRSSFGIFRHLEALVVRAHSSITTIRLMGLMLALFTVVVVLGILRQTNPLLLLLLAVAIACTPLLWLSRKANKRRRAFENKLPETLDYISRSLRAGQSLYSAIGMIGKEFPDPVGHEFKTVSDEITLGISFKDAIRQLAERVKSNDLNFFVVALLIQHETGGNLSELVDGLAKTMRERFKLRGIIRTLSSEGRTSAVVLGSMPFALAGILFFINRDYISTLWTTPQGQTLLLIAGGLMAVGFIVLNQMVQIKV